jgi:hypothetical protein
MLAASQKEITILLEADLFPEPIQAKEIYTGLEFPQKTRSGRVLEGSLADMAEQLQAARLMTLNSVWQIDKNGASKARDSISMIKFVVANTMNRIVDRALQVHGGLGMTDDTILVFFYRHERAARIYDGADEVYKSSLAKRILKNLAKNKVTIQRKKIEKTKKRLDKGFCQIFDFLFAPRGLSCKSKQET